MGVEGEELEERGRVGRGVGHLDLTRLGEVFCVREVVGFGEGGVGVGSVERSSQEWVFG